MKNRVIILDKERIAHKLRRMAYEIWEHNCDETAVTLIGIESGGKAVADNLAALVKEICPLQVTVLSVTINKKNPLNHALDFEENLTGKSVILVDDVTNSGKTITYSLHAILSYDLKKVMVAVLVDRKHKSFPVASDIVGLTIATTLQEHIEVEIQGSEITSVYLQ
ncbi:MAG: phosphoribosyltransferase [Taibaiella sp.]|nr:phosphoribosyltransferase [Taibaiella sp.]